jgi:glycosyltransferase involved in cell wall biosynthesis
MGVVTVALPVLNPGPQFAEVLAAVRAQQIDREVELLICDSGSDDDALTIAASFDARIIEIPRASFSHGGTRNLLMQQARGEHVAFLTQDAIPACGAWLRRLLTGFELAGDVALTFGPYIPRADASRVVAGEIEQWFASFGPDGGPRVDRLSEPHRRRPASEFLGPQAFFTDANGCVLHAAWERVPFRETPYAEDHQLALDMLRAGYAKAYVPDAGVIHSHEYPPAQLLRRCFDEWRGLREVYGYVEPLSLAGLRSNVIGPVRATPTVETARHHVVRYAGAVLGSRADRLPPAARRRLSLERRSTFIPADMTAND